jgi:divalent metal cation (Fe/Co/Zn/Cd) transporter
VPHNFGLSEAISLNQSVAECENGALKASDTIDRGVLARRGQRLEYFTIGWNSIEAIATLISGILAGSIALVGFVLDSVIEVVSGTALLWRLHRDVNKRQREKAERFALLIVGICFMALSTYITFDSLRSLFFRESPEHSLASSLAGFASGTGLAPICAAIGRAKISTAPQPSVVISMNSPE